MGVDGVGLRAASCEEGLDGRDVWCMERGVRLFGQGRVGREGRRTASAVRAVPLAAAERALCCASRTLSRTYAARAPCVSYRHQHEPTG
jgi:hypothetical protein